MPLPVGAKAPDFTLKRKTSIGFEDVTLSDVLKRGHAILLFVPGAFTPICTDELTEITKELEHYAGGKSEVYCISVDSAFAQEAWAKENKFEVPLLSDFKHEVTKAYDVVLPDLAGLGPAAARAVFVIDPSGTIIYSQQTEKPGDQADLCSLKEAVAAL